MSDNSKVHIEISNIAEPIPETILNNIFDFSFEKNRLGSEGEEGTGWGLPICKVFMDKYDGSIAVNSRPIKDSKLALINVKISLNGAKLI
jgi:K+-sensing histidine kinase KdpD